MVVYSLTVILGCSQLSVLLYNYPNRYDVIMARNCDTVGFVVIR